MHQKFSAVREHCPPEILTTRYSLFAAVLAEVGGYENKACKSKLTEQVESCVLCVRRKSPNPQLSTLNAQPI
jgi:hypothetical protein